MKITIDASQFQREVAFIQVFTSSLMNEAKGDVLEESTQAEGKIKEAMPVDTGRARTGWGHYTPSLMVYDDPNNQSLPSDAVWEVLNGGLDVVQGTTVPYTPRLNEGSSSQAPAGFVDAIALLMLEDLEKAIGDSAERLWVSG